MGFIEVVGAPDGSRDFFRVIAVHIFVNADLGWLVFYNARKAGTPEGFLQMGDGVKRRFGFVVPGEA